MTAGPSQDTGQDPSERRLIDRMIFFSDTIFAFALTLLAIDLRPPEGDIAEWSQQTAIRFTVFALTFAIVAIFWVGHLATTRKLLRFDWTALWMNLFFLFAIVLMPFGSSLLISRLDQTESWRIYSLIIIAASAGQTLLSLVIHRNGGRLVGGASFRERVFRVLRAASPGIAFGAGLYALELDRLDLARWCWVLIFPILMFAALLAPRKPRTAKTRSK